MHELKLKEVKQVFKLSQMEKLMAEIPRPRLIRVKFLFRLESAAEIATMGRKSGTKVGKIVKKRSVTETSTRRNKKKNRIFSINLCSAKNQRTLIKVTLRKVSSNDGLIGHLTIFPFFY